MNSVRGGPLVLIGGSEDKTVDRRILREIVAMLGSGRLLVATVASQVPQELAEIYLRAFSSLGVPRDRIEILDIRRRAEAYTEENLARVKRSDAIFFTGGDQLRITSQLGGTPIASAMHRHFKAGGLVAGTSAGAVAIPRTMIFAREHSYSHPSLNIALSAGLGLIENVVVDSHFSQRDRLSRLCGAVCQNPQNLGIGLDEDTALIVTTDDCAEVIGTGMVHFVDGTGISYSSLSEVTYEGVASIFNLRVHVLSEGDHFNIRTLRPVFD